MARDLIHFKVRKALEKDGWSIVADPFQLPIDGVKLEMDLQAEKVIEAKKGSEQIIVEIKSFNKASLLYSFYEAYGQYDFYRDALADSGIQQELFLAISLVAYKRIIKIPFLVKRIKQHSIKLIIVNLRTETIEEWKN